MTRMPCSNCGRDHASDDKLLTVTAAKFELAGLVGLCDIAISALSPKQDFLTNITAVAAYAQNERVILKVALPAIIQILRVICEQTQDKDFVEPLNRFQDMLVKVRQG